MQELYPGQGFTAYTDYDKTLDGPPPFEIRRMVDNAFVLEGTGQQDPDNTGRWFSPVVLPEGMPPGDYNIVWLGSVSGVPNRNIERFTVAEEKSDYIEIDRLFDETQPIVDALLVDDCDIVTDFNIRICSVDGNTLMTSFDAQRIARDGSIFYVTEFSDSLRAGPSAFACYVVIWQFTINDHPHVEYHFVYVANYKVLAYVNELRRMIDKAHLQHPNPALRWNDVDLVAFLNLGLQRVNASPPTQTNYTIATIPDTLIYYVLNATAIEALNSRYLAEAEAAFSFNGQPVSLEVDRTGAIESALSHYTAALEDLKTVKKGIIMATGGGGPGTGAGILVLSASPSLDLLTYRGEQYTTFRPGSRAIFYDSILSNL
jgi:hypothetical protein